MTPFDRAEEATDTTPSSERLRAFTKAVWDALVPRTGECVSLQGELIRANERLLSECLRNGMCNYYVDDETVAQNYYGALALLILDTLIANRGGALAADEVAYFADVRSRLARDRTQSLRLRDLEQKEEALTDAEARELEVLSDDPAARVNWEALCNRAERCIANWCLANPELVDRQGRPVEERGVRHLEHLLNPPPPPPKCPRCSGRGFLQPTDERKFPERCSCQTP